MNLLIFKKRSAFKHWLLPGLLGLALGLAGCEKNEAEKAKERVDQAADRAEQRIDTSAEAADEKIENAKERLETRAEQAKDYIDKQTENSQKVLENTKETLDDKSEKAEQIVDNTVENSEKKLEQIEDLAEQRADKAATYVDDSVITLNVKSALAKEPTLSAASIEVTTVGGVVTLSGTVDNEAGVATAKQIAAAQKNVKSVESALVAKTVK